MTEGGDVVSGIIDSYAVPVVDGLVSGIIDSYAVTVVDGVAYGLALFVVAAGLTLTYGVMQVLSLVHGTLYLAGAYLAWWLFDGTWAGFAAALGAGLVVGAAAGSGLAWSMRPLAGRHLNQALATLGVAFVAATVFTRVFGGEPLPVDPPAVAAGVVPMFGHTYPVWRLGFIVVAAVLAVGLFVVVERSRLGAVIRAVVADADMAAATGIGVRRVQTLVLAAGAALAVLGGVLAAPVLGPAPGVDAIVLVQSLIVVVVGGLGSIRGALVAALGVGMVTTVGAAVAPILSAFLLAAAMLVALAARRRTHRLGVAA